LSVELPGITSSPRGIIHIGNASFLFGCFVSAYEIRYDRIRITEEPAEATRDVLACFAFIVIRID
jgi:hypothetical protein